MMNARNVVWILLAVWAGIYAWSIVGLIVMPGLNRVASFFGWQMVAGCLSCVILYLGRRFDRRTAGRWLSYLPVTLATLLFVACLSLFVYGNFLRPSPESAPYTAPKTATAPAMPIGFLLNSGERTHHGRALYIH